MKRQEAELNDITIPFQEHVSAPVKSSRGIGIADGIADFVLGMGWKLRIADSVRFGDGMGISDFGCGFRIWVLGLVIGISDFGCGFGMVLELRLRIGCGFGIN